MLALYRWLASSLHLPSRTWFRAPRSLTVSLSDLASSDLPLSTCSVVWHSTWFAPAKAACLRPYSPQSTLNSCIVTSKSCWQRFQISTRRQVLRQILEACKARHHFSLCAVTPRTTYRLDSLSCPVVGLGAFSTFATAFSPNSSETRAKAHPSPAASSGSDSWAQLACGTHFGAEQSSSRKSFWEASRLAMIHTWSESRAASSSWFAITTTNAANFGYFWGAAFYSGFSANHCSHCCAEMTTVYCWKFCLGWSCDYCYCCTCRRHWERRGSSRSPGPHTAPCCLYWANHCCLRRNRFTRIWTWAISF